MTKNHFGQEAKRRREQKGLTFREASAQRPVKKLPPDPSRWSRIEDGVDSYGNPSRPSRWAILNMAAVLDWPFKDALKAAGEDPKLNDRERKQFMPPPGQGLRDITEEVERITEILNRLSPNELSALHDAILALKPDNPTVATTEEDFEEGVQITSTRRRR